MKRCILITLLIVVATSGGALAQKKKPRPRTSSKSPVAAAPVKPDFTNEIQQTAETLKALTKFIYVYGRISNGMEVAEEQARRSRQPASVIEKNADNKAGVIRGIGGLKAQVDKLGTALQANPHLQVPYINLAGVTQKISEAMDLVGSNQFDEAGRSLTAASERLTDVLLQIK